MAEGERTAAPLWFSRGGRRLFADLDDRRADCLLDPRLAHAEEAGAIDRVGAHARLEHPAHLVNPQRVVEQLHLFRGGYKNGLVLPDRSFAAVTAQGRD